jgi:hypothetical protein
MLTSEVELALFDCVEMRWRLSKQLWCELHRRLGERKDFDCQLSSSDHLSLLFRYERQPCGCCTSAILCTFDYFLCQNMLIVACTGTLIVMTRIHSCQKAPRSL